jgi:hypothetical protein
MEKYYVKLKDLEARAARLASVGKRLDSITKNLTGIANNMDTRDVEMELRIAELRSISADMMKLAERLRLMGKTLAEMREVYLLAEKDVYRGRALKPKRQWLN